jgi:hypothetical protein
MTEFAHRVSFIVRDRDDDLDEVDPKPKPPRPEGTNPVPPNSSSLPTVSQSSTGTPSPTAATVQGPPPPPPPGHHFGPAESAGIGIGVAVALLFLALGAWFLVRRRQKRRMRKVSIGSSAPDMETGMRGMNLGHKEYGPPNVKEMEAGRRASELAAHMDPVEMVGDPEFVAELQGSDVPVGGVRKQDRERLFSDAPLDADDRDEFGFSRNNSRSDFKGVDFKGTDIKK